MLQHGIKPKVQEANGTAERGATLVEYALLVALLALVVMSSVRVLGNGTSQRFDSVIVPIQGTP